MLVRSIRQEEDQTERDFARATFSLIERMDAGWQRKLSRHCS